MKQVESLLERTLEGDIEAFGQVVDRFQDMAFGCAYAILGDFHLAEDAAQEAFFTAYRTLGNLKQLERFPRWLRRIVVGSCDRIMRHRKAPAVPLREGREFESQDRDPARIAERAEMSSKVLQALRTLSEPLRTVTTLFYINDYKTDQVADFLGVPSGTVKYRLHESRKQLKERMANMVGDYLHEHRLSPEFKQEILKRISHWERFKGSDEEKADMVETDQEWSRLTELEIELEPMSEECRKIRRRISCM